MRDHLAEIRAAAQALPTDTTITILESHDRSPSGLSRVGGPGFDLGERQPSSDGRPMTHVWTLATADVPALARAYPGAAAVALYVLDPEENEAFEVDNGYTALLALSPEEVTRGEAEPTEQDLQPRAVTAGHVEVSSSAFAGYDSEDEDGEQDEGEDENSPRRALRTAIYRAGARAGGGPIWLQGDEFEGGFLLQFDESFANINLGDMGVMYIFRDAQFWQCH
jgi:hypothetical protein